MPFRLQFLAMVLLSATCVSCAPYGLPASSDHFSDIDGQSWNPSGSSKEPTVFIFLAADCPISNRYAPELKRIMNAYELKGVRFFLVYPDASERAIRTHMKEFGYTCGAIGDDAQRLIRVCGATVAPEVAVLSGSLEPVYRGRIDDRYVDFGKTRAAPEERNLVDALEAIVSGEQVLVKRTKAVGCYIYEK